MTDTTPQHPLGDFLREFIVDDREDDPIQGAVEFTLVTGERVIGRVIGVEGNGHAFSVYRIWGTRQGMDGTRWEMAETPRNYATDALVSIFYTEAGA